jgi:hypothetical protein
MRTKLDLAGIFCIASLALSMPLAAQTMPRAAGSPSASPKTAASPSGSAANQSTRPIPFHGMISDVDQNAKRFTIAGKAKSRVFKVTDKTTITKSEKAASMQDITENEEASGSYWKNADGTLEAKMVKIGPMSAREKAKEGTRKTKSSPSPAASPSPKP